MLKFLCGGFLIFLIMNFFSTSDKSNVVTQVQAKTISKNYSYVEDKDDFSNGMIYTLSIATNSPSTGGILISCFPKKKITIQLTIKDVMFPDRADIEKGNMYTSTLFKFDTASEANISEWRMNISNYKNAWYMGDNEEFLIHAIDANELNVKTGKQSTVLKFKIQDEAKKHLNNIQQKCS